MEESKKPWGNRENVFKWYFDECEESIFLPLGGNAYVDIMSALNTITNEINNDDKETALDHIYLLTEFICSVIAGPEVIQEALVEMDMKHFDKGIEELLGDNTDK